MVRMEVTWGAALQVWWSYVWRCTLLSTILAFILGFMIGIVVVVIGRPEWAGTVGAIIGYLVGIPVSVWVLKRILQKDYKGFSVALIKEDGS
jgi:hypothetical protein